MNLVNQNVVIVNPDSNNYNKIGFCKAYERGMYLVQFKDDVGFYYDFYYKGDLKLAKKETIENNVSPKSLLKSGDLVIDECGYKYRAFLEYEDNYFGKGVLVNMNQEWFLYFKNYNNDLKLSSSYGSYNIEKIYTPKTPLDYNTDDLTRYNLKWSRKKQKEMTLEEIQDALGLTKEGIELIVVKENDKHK